MKDLAPTLDAAAKPKVDILALRHRARLTGSQMKTHTLWMSIPNFYLKMNQLTIADSFLNHSQVFV